jgi:hypothetical protein
MAGFAVLIKSLVNVKNLTGTKTSPKALFLHHKFGDASLVVTG